MGQNFFYRNDRDLKFLLFEYLDADRLLGYEPYKDFGPEDFGMILDEAVKVCKEVVGPTLQDGDRIGAAYEDGRVTLPESFVKAWRVLVENGWITPAGNPEFGGQGLPLCLGGLVAELFSGANLALTNYMVLCQGAGHLIESYGTDDDRDLFVEKMYSGVWGGTMSLTEPDAGSDNGAIRTRAIPANDDGDPRLYRIEGVKSFITGGEHDLNENIIHLVLARIEGAPGGTKGLSLFIVPKIRVNPDGSLGEENDVVCGGIEHKMGIKGSATCTLNFGEKGNCRGLLLGEPHTGMRKMFQMMNESRIATGVAAMGLAASAYDTACRYAAERVQGAAFTDRRGGKVRIIEHEDVRRMLMKQKAGVEAMRGLAAKLFYLVDVSRHDPDEGERTRAARRVDLLTPMVKAYFSDFSYQLIRDAIQVLGGVGYCNEFPVEQYARDCKITSIYEGANYIQSLDLVGRKLAMDDGRVFKDWLEDVRGFVERHKDVSQFGPDFDLLLRAVDEVEQMAAFYGGASQNGNLRLVPLTATRFLETFAEAVLGTVILEQGVLADKRLSSTDPDSSDGFYYRGKVEAAHYFCRNIMTNVFARSEVFKLRDTSCLDIPEEAFR